VDLALVAVSGAQRHAVVVVAAAVPLPVPGHLQGAAEARPLRDGASRPRRVAARFAQRGEVAEDAVEKETQPGALAATVMATSLPPVVPVAAAEERQRVSAGGDGLVDGAHAVLEQWALLGGNGGLQVGPVPCFLSRERERRL